MASNVNANSGLIYKHCDKCGEPLYYGTSHICESSTDMVRKAIAARDKWWLKTVDALMHEPPCYTPADEPCTDLNCEVYPCTFMAWQQLKLSLQSSVALTNLMGKFPDLPDVREVGQ